jgi:magnesium-protoporphyrin O-methyltransferase
VSEKTLLRHMDAAPTLANWNAGRTRRISRGFYISQALEVVRA